VQKHVRFETKAAQEFVYWISDFDHLIYFPKPQVHTIYCTNGAKKVLHLDQATQIREDKNCQVNLERHTKSQRVLIVLQMNPYTMIWTWDPLDMPAVSLKIQDM
jgi:hypothetical protein